ncbi:MAG TPA: immunoglobulin domain-containing protein, partial [Methylomirabilota bacterium]|nr:immunoglobulin domain-containing protein [Methylomirabilota bacterium]
MKTNRICSYSGRAARCLTLVATGLCTVVGQMAKAQPTFYDDFETYADQPALNLVWINNSAGVSTSLPGVPADGLILTNSRSFAPPSTGTKSGATRWAHDRSYVTLTDSLPATTPALLTVYMFRNSISTGVGQTRFHVVAGSATFGSPVAGIGWFNQATASVIGGVPDVFDGNTFQGKFTGLGGNLMFNLNNPGCPRRTIGWHKFDIERLADGSTRYYVDNVLGRTVTNVSPDWIYVIAGFGTTSATPGVAGEEVDIDGVAVTTNHPSVTAQPANQLVAAGSTAVFSVAATSPGSFPITGYQWYFATNLSTTAIWATNYHSLPGKTSSTLTINNVDPTNQGQYFVVISNADSQIGSATATLTITVPSILTQPATNQIVLQGGNFNASATAGGADPLKYQWFFNVTNSVPGATTNRLTVTNVQPADAGNYTLRVTNSFGSITSAIAALTVVPNPHPTAMSLLWSKLPGDFSWLSPTDNSQRGLAYNALSNHVLVVSRVGSSLVHVLDGDTGAELRTLDPGIGTIGGGTFDVNMVGVADDGAVYVCNLTLDGPGAHFKLYRYENDDGATAPTVALDDDPGAGVTDRWGDTLAVRGAGANTQVLLASRGNGAAGNGTNLCLLTTSDGVNFVPNVLHVATTNVSDLGLGLAFGTGDTAWAKSNDGTTRG